MKLQWLCCLLCEKNSHICASQTLKGSVISLGKLFTCVCILQDDVSDGIPAVVCFLKYIRAKVVSSTTDKSVVTASAGYRSK